MFPPAAGSTAAPVHSLGNSGDTILIKKIGNEKIGIVSPDFGWYKCTSNKYQRVNSLVKSGGRGALASASGGFTSPEDAMKSLPGCIKSAKGQAASQCK